MSSNGAGRLTGTERRWHRYTWHRQQLRLHNLIISNVAS